MDSHPHGQATHGRREREHMFEKPLTPSDVGKLNRLVIPKQHAERHFPLDSVASGSGENKLLSFEDEETGKAWVFRYSYWTSSQSYVLTKGWSRFVKEKQLGAGDTVLFERTRYHRAAGGSARDHDADRLYIGCRRRRRVSSDDAGRDNATTPAAAAAAAAAAEACRANAVVPEKTSTPTGNTRRLRLFGVNLECGTEQPAEPERFVPASWCQFMPTNASNPHL